MTRAASSGPGCRFRQWSRPRRWSPPRRWCHLRQCRRCRRWCRSRRPSVPPVPPVPPCRRWCQSDRRSSHRSRRWCRAVVPAAGRRTGRLGDGVRVQRHRAVPGEQPAPEGGAVSARMDVRASTSPTNWVPRLEGGGAADLPDDVAGVGAVDEEHPAVDLGDQGRGGLEHEHGVGSPWASRVRVPVRPKVAAGVDAREQRGAARRAPRHGRWRACGRRHRCRR